MDDQNTADETIEYRLTDVPEDLWTAIKSTVSRAQNLNDELIHRLRQVSFGEIYVRDADARGRIKLPKSEYADREDIAVMVLADDDEIEERVQEALDDAR